MSWTPTPVTKICEEIVDCVNRTAPVVEQRTPYLMIRTSNIKGGRIHLDDVKFVTQETFERWTRRSIPRIGDVLLTREAPVGEVGMIRTDDKVFLGQRIVMYRANNELCDPRFLYYSFQTPYVQAQIHAFSSGSTVAHVKVPDAKKILVKLPSLFDQTRISDILSAYDDLIENNLRRIQLLEEAARCRYKLLVQDANLKKPLFEFTSLVKRGISPKYVEVEGVSVINQKCIRSLSIDFSQARLTDPQKKISEERMLQQYDTVVNSTGTGTLGRVSIHLAEDIQATVDSHVTIVRSHNEVPPLFLSMSVLTQQDVISMMGEGATNQTELSAKRLSSELMIPVIEPRAMLEYHQETASQFSLIWNLQRQNNILRHARDILLPRLMSGEIDVTSVAVPQAEAEVLETM